MAAPYDPPFYSSIVDQDVSTDGNPRYFSGYFGDKSAADTGDKKVTLVAFDGGTERQVILYTNTAGSFLLDLWDSVGGTISSITMTTTQTTFHLPVDIDDTTATSSPTTGALVVAGGVGIGGDMRVAGEYFGDDVTLVGAMQADTIHSINQITANGYIRSSTGEFTGKEIDGGTWYLVSTILQNTNDHIDIETLTKNTEGNVICRKHFIAGCSTSETGPTFNHNIESGEPANHPRVVAFGATTVTESEEIIQDVHTTTLTPTSTEGLWQSFTAVSGDPLTKLEVSVSTSFGLKSGTIGVKIYTGTGLTGTLIAGISPVTGVNGYTAFIPTSPIPLIAGDVYTFELIFFKFSPSHLDININSQPPNGPYLGGEQGLDAVSSVTDDMRFKISTTETDTPTCNVYIWGQDLAGAKNYVTIRGGSASPIWTTDGTTAARPDSFADDTDLIYDTANLTSYPPDIRHEVGKIISHSTDGAVGTSVASLTSRGGIVSEKNLHVGTTVRADMQSDFFRFHIGSSDETGRRQIWYYGSDDADPGNASSAYGLSGPIFRLGSATVDGDNINVISEGFITYGMDVSDNPMSTTSYSIGRLKPDDIYLFQDLEGGNPAQYVFRVNHTALTWRPADGTSNVLSVTSGGATITGTVTAAGRNIGTDGTNQDNHISSTSNPHSTTIDQVTPTTTKGDIIAEDGSNAIRLAVGTNGDVLTADSTEPTGVKWAAGGAVVVTEVNAATTTSTTSASFVDMNAMATTPAAGVWWVEFTASASLSDGQSNCEYAIFLDTTEQTKTNRGFGNGDGNGFDDIRSALHTAGKITTTGAEAIKIRYHRGAATTSTFSVYERTLSIREVT